MPDQLPQAKPSGLTVDSIVPVPAPAVPAGAVFYELETQKFQLEKFKITIDALRRDVDHRDKWANRLFPVCAGWLIAVLIVLGLQGFHVAGFHLNDSVLIAFIGTTTADVLGLGYIVVNYLFPKPSA
ncbi:MAG TPA: hypothetical protein VIW68_11010 [Candidatus Sulfotelmatobacter sp.]